MVPTVPTVEKICLGGGDFIPPNSWFMLILISDAEIMILWPLIDCLIWIHLNPMLHGVVPKQHSHQLCFMTSQLKIDWEFCNSCTAGIKEDEISYILVQIWAL